MKKNYLTMRGENGERLPISYRLHLRDAYMDGFAEGMAEGMAEVRLLMGSVFRMMRDKVPYPEIALKTDLPLHEVEEIAKGFGFDY